MREGREGGKEREGSEGMTNKTSCCDSSFRNIIFSSKFCTAAEIFAYYGNAV